jgi:excinuclease ABC subunit C
LSSPLLATLPHDPGVYLMRDTAGGILYIGKALDLRKRVAHYFRPDVEPKIRALMADVRHIDYIAAAGERDALVIEQRLIQRHQPLYNTMWKDGKSYPFVKLSLNEDFPRLRLTRVRLRDGARYFGPYPNVRAVRHLLEWVWRNRLFLLRPCDLEIFEGRVFPYEKVKSCLYLHTGECPAPCLGRISKADYGKIAERARLFFEGKNTELLGAWRNEMKEAADRLEFERAGRLRDSLRALDHIREPVTFRRLKEEDVQGRLESSRALQALQTALSLPRPPGRIECFDISHIQGSETVASLVCFDRGRPNKDGYRKFKIKTVRGVDDFASMAEVVARRYRRVEKEGLPWPDLILIDGGPGQLSAAARALAEVTDRKIPLASLAKREEEIFQPGSPTPLRLPKDSPALQLLQRVRDEAHRFAVSFHRARRNKAVYFKKEAVHENPRSSA